MTSAKAAGVAPSRLRDKDNDMAESKEDSPGTRAPPRKRRRIVISCTECHRRKQKCDRKLPCNHCVARSKQAACHYDSSAPTMKEDGARQRSLTSTSTPATSTTTANGTEMSPAESSEGRKEGRQHSIPAEMADFGYPQTDAGPASSSTTLDFLRRIEGAHAQGDSADGQQQASPYRAHRQHHPDTRERYKSLVRQLPPRGFVDRLVAVYFADINWQYYGLERDLFERQRAAWEAVPAEALSNGGPQALPPELRAFPGLLFQVLATALLVLPPPSSEGGSSDGVDPTFEELKYTANMTLDDLALDYSESGVAILSLLGKRQMTFATVQTGFLRASFLKYAGLVTEAWHAIGNAIRDGQEIGLHRPSLDPRPRKNTPEAVLENEWEIQRRRRLWMTLVQWDAHTGVVFGRPLTVDASTHPVIPPVDAPIPTDRSHTPVQPRGANDPPTPLTRALWAHQLTMPLRRIVALEKDGCDRADGFAAVDAIDAELHELEARPPPFFRPDDPDTRFDAHPDCFWLPVARATLPALSAFSRMALHRPYIFTRAKSRTEALRASLDMLRAQRRHFQVLNPPHYKTFSLFFGSFDAIVLMASIYILFPKEHPELVTAATQHFQWAVERFEAMSARNSLARAALGVLRAIHVRLRRVLGLAAPPQQQQQQHHVDGAGSMAATPAATSERYSLPAATDSNNTSGLGTPATPSGPLSMFQQQPLPQPDFDWSIPADFDWASIQPIFATGDLVYHDLIGIGSANASSIPPLAADAEGMLAGVGTQQQPWLFDGEFGNDSVWSLLNQYTPF